MTKQRITPVILSGGAGTRLWPLSRLARPKQLQPLSGAATLLQMTAERISNHARFTGPIVVANGQHADEVESQLALAGIEPLALILEPIGRNTAPAIALAALCAPPDATLLVMPSDHVIEDADAFLAAVAVAEPLAQDGWLVTFGVSPDRPETGYGYIERGAALAKGIFKAERFVEKPSRAVAEDYCAAGSYAWNAGIFLFRADRIVEELRRSAPDILETVTAALATAVVNGRRTMPAGEIFAGVRSQSIDHAVMEGSERIAVVPVEMAWSDVGSWDAVFEIGRKDAAGNSATGTVIAIDCNDCLLRSHGPLIATVGIKDLIVVATADAVLILPRSESQRVKEVVQLLEERGHPSLKE